MYNNDFVVEQGTSGIWTYRKWNSGIAECWGIHTATLTHYSTLNGFYGFYTAITYPFTFNNVPIPLFTPKVGSGFAVPAASLSRTKKGCNIYALASASGSQATEWFVSVKGAWK